MDGDLLKKCFPSATELIFRDFKNKIDIITTMKELQLSRRAIAKRVELLGENINNKLMLDIQDYHAFSLQLDKLRDFTA